jgi:putative membrane protein
MRRERVLREAEIAPSVVRYHVLATVAALAVTVVGIVVIPIVAPIVYLYYTRYYQRLSVRLTSRELKVRRGILVVEEKSTPLEKITDLAVYQGPVMRAMGLKGIKVETAGQTSTTGSALVTVVGIVDTDDFRDLVLEQRDRVADRDDAPPLPPGTATAARAGSPAAAGGAGEGGPAGAGGATEAGQGGTPGVGGVVAVADPALLATLAEIRDVLRRIEAAVARGATPAQ